MKFNNIKDQLKKWEDKNAPKIINQRRLECDSVPKRQQNGKIYTGPGCFVNKVVGGGISRKPVDKQSAMLISKAPWWAKPLPIEQKDIIKMNNDQKIIVKNGINAVKSESGTHLTPVFKKINVDGHEYVDLSNFSKLFSEALKGYFEKNVYEEHVKFYSNEISVLKKKLEEGLEEIKGSFKAYSDDIAQSKYHIDSQTKSILQDIRDIRKFFMDSNHAEEMARLKEFVDVCERLKTLKDSGFVDAVTDTILKLAK